MSENLQTVAVPVLSVLGLFASGLNILHIIALVYKQRQKKLNAYQTLQVCNTVLVLVILGSVISMDVVHLGSQVKYSVPFCILRDFCGKLLLNIYPLVQVVVSGLRKKISRCRVDAMKLIPRFWVLKQFAICFSLSILFLIPVPVIHALKQEDASTKDSMSCFWSRDVMMITILRLTLCVCFDLLPVFVIIKTYQMIYVAFKRSHPNANETNGHIKRNDASHRLKRMKLMYSLLSARLFIAWIPYISLKVYGIVNHPTQLVNVCYLLCKVMVCILHPITEGLFLSDQRKCLRLCFADLSCRPIFVNRKNAMKNTVAYEVQKETFNEDKVPMFVITHEPNLTPPKNKNGQKKLPEKSNVCSEDTPLFSKSLSIESDGSTQGTTISTPADEVS